MGVILLARRKNEYLFAPQREKRSHLGAWLAVFMLLAAVVAAVENGYCNRGEDITVKMRGGDLIVHYTEEQLTLTGGAELVYNGETEV